MAVTRWFDGHLDLTYLADHGRDLTLDNTGRPSDDGAPPLLSFASLREARVLRACSTLFVRRRREGVDGPYCFDTPDEAHAAALRQLQMHDQWNRAGFLNAPGALSPTLAIEGAACLRTLDDFDTFHAAGVRMVALAWAEGNAWAGGDQSGGDITPAGLQLIAHLDARSCIHDVSHLSEPAFWTLLNTAKGPIVASHSNCRSLLPGAPFPDRHLSDPQIRALAARNALIGVNLFARFLIPADALKAGRRPTSADVAHHAEHIAQTAGRRNLVALGSDMESGFGLELMPTDVRGPAELVHIAEALAARGWSDAEIEGFAWSNWARLLGP